MNEPGTGRKPAHRRRTWIAAALAFTAPACVPTAGGGAEAGAPPLVTDRPDFTESATAVPGGRAQVEAGYTIGGFQGGMDHSIGEVLVRIGVGRGAEARLGLGSVAVQRPDPGEDRSGLEGASLGAKIELQGPSIAPELALLLGAGLPGSAGLGADRWTPFLLVSSAWSGPTFDVGANVGVTANAVPGGDAEWSASVAVGFPVRGQLAGFGEVYALMEPSGDVTAVADAGLTFPLSRDAQVDARLERELRDGGRTAVGLGMAWRWAW